MVSQRHGGADLSFLQEGLRWVDRVVCVSQACSDDFVATTGFDAAQVVVIPNPSFLATGIKQPAQPVLRVGTASNLHAAKGIDVLLSAWAMLKERGVTLELQIAGGEPDVVSRWQVVAHRLGIDESVHFLGALDSAERMDAFYREIGLMVVPSRSESFSLQVLEACSRGIPVVVSDIPALREVLDDAGVFFSVGNARELADCVEKFSRSYDVLACYSNKVFARWERCFSTETVLDSYQRLYFELERKVCSD
jgi:glycosyltransferase involved in cell wall biosynthesis